MRRKPASKNLQVDIIFLMLSSSVFNFDRVFDERHSNEEIFDSSIQKQIQAFLEGYNTCVMVYGVTGAGKTHTIFGSMGSEGSDELGVIAYTLAHLLSYENISYRISYLEIYNERVKDLLGGKKDLTIRETSDGKIVIPDLEVRSITSISEVFSMVLEGNKQRKMAKTNRNQFSSRSHAIFQIEATIPTQNGYVRPKLSFVDLAGCERITSNKIIVKRQKEGSKINKSLLALRNVISKLSLNRTNSFINYRDSKLTRVLKDSLGENTRTILITCITPQFSQIEETFHSLQFSLVAKKIYSEVHRNEEVQPELGKTKKRDIHDQIMDASIRRRTGYPRVRQLLILEKKEWHWTKKQKIELVGSR